MLPQWQHAAAELHVDDTGILMLVATMDSRSAFGKTRTFAHAGYDGWQLVAVHNINGRPHAFFKRLVPVPDAYELSILHGEEQ